MISGNKGYLNDCVKMYEKSLYHKAKVYPQNHQEILQSLIYCAQAYNKLTDWERSYQYYQRAFDTSKNVKGEFDIKTAQILISLSQSLIKCNRFSEAIKTYEHAGMILNRLEGHKFKQFDGSEDITFTLNKLYLQLINTYMLVNKTSEAQIIVNTLDSRINNQELNENSFKILNELANLMRKHNNLELAINFYKKSLLYLKKKYNNNYMNVRDTSKILINIATTEYIKGNNSEALQYYQHAITVITNSRVVKSCADPELAKIYLSMAHIAQNMGNFKQAHNSYNQSIAILERSTSQQEDLGTMLMEAKFSLRRLTEEYN